jgi:predicted transcriptional regulator
MPDKHQVSIYLTDDLRVRLLEAAEREHRTPSNLMQFLIIQYLKEQNGNRRLPGGD